MIEWLDVENGNAVLETGSDVTQVDLELSQVAQNMDGRMYRCRVTRDGSSVTRDVAVTIQGEYMQPWIVIEPQRSAVVPLPQVHPILATYIPTLYQ